MATNLSTRPSQTQCPIALGHQGIRARHNLDTDHCEFDPSKEPGQACPVAQDGMRSGYTDNSEGLLASVATPEGVTTTHRYAHTEISQI